MIQPTERESSEGTVIDWALVVTLNSNAREREGGGGERKQLQKSTIQRSKVDGMNKIEIYNFSEAIWLDCGQIKAPGRWPVITAECAGLTSELTTLPHSTVY